MNHPFCALIALENKREKNLALPSPSLQVLGLVFLSSLAELKRLDKEACWEVNSLELDQLNDRLLPLKVGVC